MREKVIFLNDQFNKYYHKDINVSEFEHGLILKDSKHKKVILYIFNLYKIINFLDFLKNIFVIIFILVFIRRFKINILKIKNYYYKLQYYERLIFQI